MFEAWEIQAGRVDLDLDALNERGVLIAGTNERHPLIDVFSYLGLMAIVQLADAGVPALGSRIGLLCDNPFIESMTAGLASAGATVFSGSTLEHLVVNAPLDAVIVAMTPTGRPLIAAAEAAIVVDTDPAMTIVQFWGDIDRVALEQKSISYWPRFDPGTGHMGVLPSRVGPEPIVKLQTGGLKVAQVLRIAPGNRTAADLRFLSII